MQLEFSQVFVIEIAAGTSVPISVNRGTIWKIESAAIAGTGGSLYLQSGSGNIGILFTSIDNNRYGCQLPFWINDSLEGSVMNESKFNASLSISEWNIVV